MKRKLSYVPNSKIVLFSRLTIFIRLSARTTAGATPAAKILARNERRFIL
jgi:hypothetical protein